MSVVGNEPVSTDNLKAALEAGGGVSRDTLFHGGDYNTTNYSDTFLGSLSDFSELVIGLMNTYSAIASITVPAAECSDKAISGNGMQATLWITEHDGYFDIRVRTTSPTFTHEIIGIR